MYILFSITGVAMTTFVYFLVPETKGLRLEDMDDVFGVPRIDEGISSN
jgi:hypothetical protein